MEVYPYAVFTFKRKVKSLKGLLKGTLKEEKDFFKTLSIKGAKTLQELAKAYPPILNLLKAFENTQSATRILTKIDNTDYFLEIAPNDTTPYSITLKLIKEDYLSTFREITYAIPVATVLLDDQSRILDVNPQFEHLFGYKKEEILNKDLNRLIVPKEELSDGKALDSVAKGTGYVKVERTRLAKNGTKIPVLVSGSPFVVKGNRIGVIGVYEDIRDIKKVQEALYHQATHDILTGLPNRYLLEDRFKMEKARADRSGSKVAIFFIDINRFKDINDTFGHDVGDKVIKSVAELLVSSVRATDSVVRFGGDEFVIVFDEVKNMEDIVTIALKVINAFSKPIQINGLTLEVGINMGIAVYPDNGITLEELLRKGDLAMYEAKAIGSNNFVFYSESIEEARLKTISDLKAREIMFNLVFNKSPIPQLIVDDELKVLRVNEKFKEVFKIDIKALYGKNIEEIEGLKEIAKYINGNGSNEELSLKLILNEKEYNIKCKISRLRSFGKLFYLIVFTEVS